MATKGQTIGWIGMGRMGYAMAEWLLKAGYDTTHVGADLPAFEEALTRFFP